MIAELQRSVIFFSRANETLKQQNDELTTLLMQAQAQVKALEGGKEEAQEEETTAAVAAAPVTSAVEPKEAETVIEATPVVAATPAPDDAEVDAQTVIIELGSSSEGQTHQEQQARAQAVATQALYEAQGFPAAAARPAAQTINGSTPTSANTANCLAQMQPGDDASHGKLSTSCCCSNAISDSGHTRHSRCQLDTNDGGPSRDEHTTSLH